MLILVEYVPVSKEERRSCITIVRCCICIDFNKCINLVISSCISSLRKQQKWAYLNDLFIIIICSQSIICQSNLVPKVSKCRRMKERIVSVLFTYLYGFCRRDWRIFLNLKCILSQVFRYNPMIFLKDLHSRRSETKSTSTRLLDSM